MYAVVESFSAVVDGLDCTVCIKRIVFKHASLTACDNFGHNYAKSESYKQSKLEETDENGVCNLGLKLIKL